jgi:hypothetical protein
MSSETPQEKLNLCTRCKQRPFIYGSPKDGLCELCAARIKAMGVLNPKNKKPRVDGGIKYCVNCDQHPVDHAEGGSVVCYQCCEQLWRDDDRGLNKRKHQKKIIKDQRRNDAANEESFVGSCRGCGKAVEGSYTCHDCRVKQAEENFMIQPGQVELVRHAVGKVEDKIVKQVVVTDASSIEMEEMLWLWPNRIPEGAITWIMGQPNNAKSLLTIEIAKCATTGTDWPDGTPNTMGKCKVLMYCGEDSLSKVVIPRLKAAGADLSPGMIGFMDRKSFRTIAGDNSPEKRPLDLGEDLDTLLELAKKHPDVRMIVVDPITGVFGNKSINKNEEANPILEKLIDFCETTGIAFVGVTHVPKRSTNSAIEKIAGGSAVGGSAKSAFMLSRDPDSDDVHNHLLTMVKWNYTGEASGMKYSTVPAEVEHKGKKLKIAKIVWGESTDMIADDVLVAQNSKKDDRDRQQDKCDAWLSAYLGDTPRKSKDVYTAAEAQGYGSSTVKRSLENLNGRHIDGRKIDKGLGWWMALPGVEFPAPKEEKLIALAADEGL